MGFGSTGAGAGLEGPSSACVAAGRSLCRNLRRRRPGKGGADSNFAGNEGQTRVSPPESLGARRARNSSLTLISGGAPCAKLESDPHFPSLTLISPNVQPPPIAWISATARPPPGSAPRRSWAALSARRGCRTSHRSARPAKRAGSRSSPRSSRASAVRRPVCSPGSRLRQRAPPNMSELYDTSAPRLNTLNGPDSAAAGRVRGLPRPARTSFQGRRAPGVSGILAGARSASAARSTAEWDSA